MNPLVDKYIENSEEFAQPILIHLRQIIHEACPEIVEKIKWSFPNFEYKGSILCSMASFKKHCTFGFWLGGKMDDPDKILNTSETNSMGQLGRISNLKDLPADEIMKRYILEAMRLVDSGIKQSKNNTTSNSKELILPKELIEALKQNEKALATFERFSYSQKKEYVVWISEAKTIATKEKRLTTTIEWLIEGKSRNWKYEKK